MSTLYHFMADVLAGCYAATHNYALAIALLTLATVAITTPLTWKSSRGMIAMQALQPEIKKLQQKYKGDRVALNEEMSKLYREQGINPLGGCLPLVPQMVVFYILYHTISNLSHKLTFTTQALAQAKCPRLPEVAAQITQASGKYTCAAPSNIGQKTLLYNNLLSAGGHMRVFGFDLSTGVTTAHGTAMIGCWILVALVVGAQYFQTRQVNRRNPSAAANPQAQMMQRIFPLFFGFISIKIQAGVNVYFLVSALCRIAQQSLMFRYDPVLKRQLAAARSGKTIDIPPRSSRARSGPGGSASPLRPGGGLARLLGLGDGGAGDGRAGAEQAADKNKGSGNLDRFLGDKNGAKGTLSDGSGRPSANGAPKVSSNGRNPGGGRGNARRGPSGRGASSQPKALDNRSRSKRSRRPR
jgi:YidC/Oxa1 family membrane protein insertase